MNGHQPAAERPRRPGPALITLLAVGFVIAVTITAGVVHLIHRVTAKVTQSASRRADTRSADRKGAVSTSGASNGSAATSALSNANPAGAKPAAPYGWTLKNGKLVPASAPGTESAAAPPTLVPTSATGDPAKDWALEYERTENGPEADLVVRTGDINNLGFGWTRNY